MPNDINLIHCWLRSNREGAEAENEQILGVAAIGQMEHTGFANTLLKLRLVEEILL